MDIQPIIKAAIETGEVIMVVYDGGHDPSSIREIVPIQVDGEYVQALCVASQSVKTFIIAKMRIAMAGETATYNPLCAAEPVSLAAAIEPFLETIATLGWHLELTDTSASLHERFKTGKPKRGQAVLISYSKDTPSRPWYVRIEIKGIGRSFGNLSKAITLFMEGANIRYPNLDKASGD